MHLRSFLLYLLLSIVQALWAQDDFPQMELSDKLAEVELDSCRITDIGVVVSDIKMFVKTDSLTQKVDTTLIIDQPVIAWRSEGYDVLDLEETGRQRMARRILSTGLDDYPSHQYGNLQEMFQNFYYYVFSYEYQSVDADGNPITLSAMAACPADHASQVNNVIIGTHITITSDWERPTSHFNNFSQDDWGMLFSLAGGPKMLFTEKYSHMLGATQAGFLGGLAGWFAASFVLSFIPVVGAVAATLIITGATIVQISGFVYLCDQLEKAYGYHGYNNNLVIMPDYEGYGASKHRAHPYLYQELTARQCVDATLYGMKLYQSDMLTQYIRRPFRKDFRTMSCGYSQGGSVALAVHRFIEQNNLDQTLHFSGSYCGDGPYDPISTLMYYVEQDKKGEELSMPVVLPLIVKGMLDTNPYMMNHKAEEYFNPKFLETGIMQWLADKEMSTVNIGDAFGKLYREGKNGDPNYYRDIFAERIDSEGALAYRARLSAVMNPECYAYFSNLYDQYKNSYTAADGIPLPIKRGVMEDLHLALASNDMTKGWKPRHKVMLFHSKGDTVVPYVNAQKAVNTLGDMVILNTAPNGLDHGQTGVDFFKGDSDILDIVFERTLNLRLYEYVVNITSKPY